MWRVVVCDQETSKNEEAKARYRAVKIQPQLVVTPGKQTTNNNSDKTTEVANFSSRTSGSIGITYSHPCLISLFSQWENSHI
jgi:hypothetical protein